MTRMQAAGWWLVGIMIGAGVSLAAGFAIWSTVRTGKETMEGGWSRTTIDQNLSPWPYVLITFAITIVVWTLGVIAYHFVNQDIISKPKEAV